MPGSVKWVRSGTALPFSDLAAHSCPCIECSVWWALRGCACGSQQERAMRTKQTMVMGREAILLESTQIANDNVVHLRLNVIS